MGYCFNVDIGEQSITDWIIAQSLHSRTDRVSIFDCTITIKLNPSVFRLRETITNVEFMHAEAIYESLFQRSVCKFTNQFNSNWDGALQNQHL